MGWLADLLTTVNNPIAKLIPKNTMYRDLADHFGAVGTNKWYEAGGDVITGDKPFNWETISEGLQGAGKSTPTGRAVDNFAWKVIGPLILNQYAGPAAAAAGSALGQKLAGESDRSALVAAGSTYAGGKLSQLGSQYSQGASSSKELGSLGIGNPGAYGGSSANITTAARNTGTLAKVLNVAKNALTQGIDRTADANNQQNFGLNKFSYLTGIIGDALNPTSPLRGVGQSLAQQNQFSRATAANKKKQSIASSLIKSIMLGEMTPTEKGKEGLSDFRIVAGKDGRPVMKMEYDLSNDDLAAAYNPQEDNILTPEMQSAVARQSDQVADTEMSIAQLLAKQKADAQKAIIDAQERKDKLTRQAEQDEREKERLELARNADRRASSNDEYRRERDDKLDSIAEEKRLKADERQQKMDEESSVLNKLREQEAQLRIRAAKIKEGVNPDTGQRMTSEEKEKQISANKAEDLKNKTYQDVISMAQGKVRNPSGTGMTDAKTPEHVHDINRRLAEYAPKTANAFVWFKDRPLMVEFTDGRTLAQLYEFAEKDRGTKSLTDYIQERLLIDVAAGNAKLINPELLTKGFNDPEDDWNAELEKIRIKLGKAKAAQSGGSK